MIEEDWRPLRDLGFDDNGCLEVAHLAGMFNYITRMADAFGVQLDPGTREAAASGEPLRPPG
jgi:hypothetical protein